MCARSAFRIREMSTPPPPTSFGSVSHFPEISSATSSLPIDWILSGAGSWCMAAAQQCCDRQQQLDEWDSANQFGTATLTLFFLFLLSKKFGIDDFSRCFIIIIIIILWSNSRKDVRLGWEPISDGLLAFNFLYKSSVWLLLDGNDFHRFLF